MELHKFVELLHNAVAKFIQGKPCVLSSIGFLLIAILLAYVKESMRDPNLYHRPAPKFHTNRNEISIRGKWYFWGVPVLGTLQVAASPLYSPDSL
eukprot:3733413-Amphidinium_carterae.1